MNRRAMAVLILMLCNLLASQAVAESFENVLGDFEGAIVVAEGETIRFATARGPHNRETKRPFTRSSQTVVGSVSKPITATLVLQEVERGRIDLDAPVTRYLSQLPDRWNAVTVRHLLSHAGGVPHYDGVAALGYSRQDYFETAFTPTALVDLVGRMPLSPKTGVEACYSSPGYMLLGAVLEVVTGKSYGALIEERIARPLGLQNTHYGNATALADDNVARAYVPRRNGFVDTIKSFSLVGWEPAPFRDPTNAYAAGGVISTADDLLRFALALRHGELLSPETTEQMFKGQAPGYGLGWFENDEQMLRASPTVQLWSHGGGFVAYRSYVALFDDGITIALTSNGQRFNMQRLVAKLHAVARGCERPRKDIIHPSLRNLKAFDEEGGLEAYARYHRELSRRAGHPIQPSESTTMKVVAMHADGGRTEEVDAMLQTMAAHWQGDLEPLLHGAGYGYLEGEDVESALAWFQRSVEMSPRSANAHDSLGEAYVAKKDLARARTCFETAVSLARESQDPRLPAFEQHLQELSP